MVNHPNRSAAANLSRMHGARLGALLARHYPDAALGEIAQIVIQLQHAAQDQRLRGRDGIEARRAVLHAISARLLWKGITIPVPPPALAEREKDPRRALSVFRVDLGSDPEPAGVWVVQEGVVVAFL